MSSQDEYNFQMPDLKTCIYLRGHARLENGFEKWNVFVLNRWRFGASGQQFLRVPSPPPRDGYCRNVDTYYPTVCNISSPCNQYILLKSNHAHTPFMLSEFVFHLLQFVARAVHLIQLWTSETPHVTLNCRPSAELINRTSVICIRSYRTVVAALYSFAIFVCQNWKRNHYFDVSMFWKR